MRVRAPARVCFFGEHQDYLGLPVIAEAVDLFFEIKINSINENVFIIEKPDLKEVERFSLNGELTYQHSRDYLKAAVNVYRRIYKKELPSGYKFVFKSQIPVGAGCSSSSVMLVAWVTTLMLIDNNPDVKHSEKIAYLAYLSEVEEFSEAGGMMDHFTSAIGGLLYIETRWKPPRVEKLPVKLNGLVIANSGPKDTVGVLKEIRHQVEEGIKLLREKYPRFDIHTTPFEDVKQILKRLPDVYAKKLEANIKNRDITKRALSILRKGSVSGQSLVELGNLMYEHHRWLSEGLGVSTPKLDQMVEAALKAGAFGAKLNGSGRGGTMVALAPGREEKVAEALRRFTDQVWIVNCAGGVSWIL